MSQCAAVCRSVPQCSAQRRTAWRACIAQCAAVRRVFCAAAHCALRDTAAHCLACVLHCAVCGSVPQCAAVFCAAAQCLACLHCAVCGRETRVLRCGAEHHACMLHCAVCHSLPGCVYCATRCITWVADDVCRPPGPHVLHAVDYMCGACGKTRDGRLATTYITERTWCVQPGEVSHIFTTELMQWLSFVKANVPLASMHGLAETLSDVGRSHGRVRVQCAC